MDGKPHFRSPAILVHLLSMAVAGFVVYYVENILACLISIRGYDVAAGLVTCMTDVLVSVGRKTASWNDKGEEETKGELFLPDPYLESTE